MLFSLKQRLRKKWFDYHIREIYQTPPVDCNPNSPLIVLSQIHHPDLSMYMIAVKSFARFVTPQRFVIIDDGLSESDRSTLRRHLSSITFRKTQDVPIGPCPHGGTWERLLGIADISALGYVIQLDADTVTLNSPTEVIEAIASNRSFTLGTSDGQSIVDLTKSSRIASGWTSQHVQALAEQALVRLPPRFHPSFYVRGCSGFAGFAAGYLQRSAIYEFSEAMAYLLGHTKWREWGSEQVTSNYLIANATSAMVLPIKHYPFWKNGVNLSNVKFIHFFGPHRFNGGRYLETSLRLIKELRHE